MALGYLVPLDKQLFDDDGAPLAGGKLNAYISGTSTRQAMYTTSALVTPTANPVILDASGRWTAYIDDGVAYKLVLTDANDVVVETWDPVQIPEIAVAPASNGVATGTVTMFGGTVAPTGYQLCVGTAISRSTYADLFAVIGTTFGVGNGSTTFNLPDLQQRFPIGKATSGTGSTLGSTGGTIDHVHAGPSHTHGVAAHSHTIAHTHSVPRDGWGGIQVSGLGTTGRLLANSATTANNPEAQTNNTTGASSVADSGTTILTTDAGGTANTGTANPPFQVINFIIKE